LQTFCLSKNLVGIFEAVTKVTGLIEDIASASKEQAEGISQVNQGLGQIGQIAQQTTASAEECAAASTELLDQARKLNSLMETFKVNGHGKKKQPLPEEKPMPTHILLDDQEFGKYSTQ
jgi:methyl-accepting chemotaxis protein